MSKINKDYYETLGVSPNADLSYIQTVYRRLAKIYHPDLNEGDKEFANAKMAELNEAWAVLSDPIKRKEFDSNRNEPVSASDETLFKSILLNYSEIEEYPEVSVNELPFEKFLCNINITIEQALNKIKTNLDTNQYFSKSKIVNTRIVLVPITHTRSYLSAEWNAACNLVVSSKEVMCVTCRGRGTTGAGKNKQRCTSCKGKGKDLNTVTQKKLETGQSAVSLDEAFTNLINDIGYKLDPIVSVTNSIPLLNTAANLKCLQPKINSAEDLTEFVLEDLSERLTTKIRKKLNHYDKVEKISFVDDSIDSSISLKTYFYPIYICLITLNKKRCFILCDAVTGNVVLPDIDPVNKTSKVGKLVRWVVGIFLGLIILGSIIGKDDTPSDLQGAPKSIELSEKNATAKASDKSQPTAVKLETKTNSNETQTIKPSFDCLKANTKSEILICANSELAILDYDYSELLLKAKNAVSDSTLESELLEALEWRQQNCADDECVKEWYLTQIKTLNSKLSADVIPQQQEESLKDVQKPDAVTEKKCTSVESLMHSNGC